MRARIALAALLAASGASAQAATPAPCATPDHAQLDFWVGEWDVYKRDGDTPVARSRVEKLYDGCAIREHWMPLGNSGGGSLSNYDVATRKWRQTWIDNSGVRVEFEGGMQGATMVLEGRWLGLLEPGKEALIRMSYAREPDGSVRQWGVASKDGGKSWEPSFDLIYRRRS